MKYLKVGDTILADCYKAKVIKITGDGVVGLVLNDGLCVEFYYECSLHDISLDDNGDFVLDTEFFPVVGDVIRINDEEFQLADIDEGVVTLKRGDEIRYYSFCDIEHDIINGYWISNMCEQVFSPTVKRKLEVYEVQDSVYLYNSLEELKEIYELLNKPYIHGGDYSSNDALVDGLKYEYGIIHYWEYYDSGHDFVFKYIKVIQGATFIEELIL